MASRPVVSVFDCDNASETVASVRLPAVFIAPIRPDVVSFVHSSMAKNKRQAYAVSVRAGHQTSAASWGTGRAVSRIPRVAGGGTHRAGQGAFGNMCRGGRMFAPTKVWRKWHKRINVNQRRYALASALAASALPALVMARGHKIDQVPQVPLVLCNGTESVQKTKNAVAMLERFGAGDELNKCKQSRKIRSGKGKMRNRRFVMRRGPLVIHAGKGEGLEKAFRNIPGVDLACVDRLNLLQLAPGGHLGRFCVWTQGAFEKLDELYGTYTQKSSLKKDYQLPRPQMVNADVARLINSDEVQSVVRPAIKQRKHHLIKKNPLKNYGAMVRLNPHAQCLQRAELKAAEARSVAKAAKVEAARKGLPTASGAAANKAYLKLRKAASKKQYNLISADDL